MSMRESYRLFLWEKFIPQDIRDKDEESAPDRIVLTEKYIDITKSFKLEFEKLIKEMSEITRKHIVSNRFNDFLT